MGRRPCVLGVLILTIFPLSACFGQEEEIRGKKLSEWLKMLKTHKEAKNRRAAVIVLSVVGPKVNGVLDGLFDAVANDPDPEVRRDIALTLGRMGMDAKGAGEVLGDVLKNDKSEIVREAAALSLAGKLNEQAFTQVVALAGALKDSHAGTRAAAAEALKNLGEKAKLVLPQLTAVAQDPKADKFTRLYAMQMISKWGDDGTVKVLAGIYKDTTAPADVRQGALAGIGGMGEKSGPAVPVLAHALAEKQVELRRAAAVALVQIGSAAKEAWPAAKEAYKDADSAVRNQVIRLAGTLGKDQKEAVTLLAKAAVDDANLENRLAAIQELAQLESAATEALPTLVRLAAEDVRAAVREAADAAVKRIKGEP
jgi:HEAT repeat protein